MGEFHQSVTISETLVP